MIRSGGVLVVLVVLAMFVWLGAFPVPVCASNKALTFEDGRGMKVEPYQVNQVDGKVKVDGHLDEAVWDKALVIGLPYEVGPGENEPAPIKTEVLIMYGKRNFYIGFRCYDPDPSQIRARYTDRDNIYGDDEVRVFLGTFNDNRSAFMFSCNPLGVQRDSRMGATSSDSAWDGIYDSAGGIHDWGYSVEMVIPFSSLRFQGTAQDQIWSIHFSRFHPRSVVRVLWPYPNNFDSNCFLCQFGRIKGMKGVSPGKNIEINPTLTAVLRRERPELPGGAYETVNKKPEAGLTMRWGVTPSIALSATVNPEFSQVEADALQLDINQPFALFYNEKRPFFVEGAGYFDTPIRAVHSRTMRDPDWGIKVTGKEKGNAVGAYMVRDRLTNLIFPGSEGSSSTSLDMANTASVFRYKRDIWNNSTIGVLYTGREGDNYFNRVLGVDGMLRIGERNSINFNYLGSSTRYPHETAVEFDQPLDKFTGSAARVYYEYMSRRFFAWVNGESVSPQFRADQGFVPKVGYRNVDGGLNYMWRAKPGKWWVQTNIEGQFGYIADWEGRLLHKYAAIRGVLESKMQSLVFLKAIFARKGYDGVEFDLKDLRFIARMKPHANLQLRVNAAYGDDIDYDNTRKGTRSRFVPSVVLNLGKHFRLDFSHTYERMQVNKQRLYTANISSAEMIYKFNRRMLFRSLIQYVDYNYNTANYLFEVDSLYRGLMTQLLFSYKINPRTVMYLGYSDNYYGAPQYSVTRNEYTLFAKVSYAWVL